MKAAVYTRYGSPDVVQIREIDKPVPAAHEVLIKVYATTVNRTDCGFRDPRPFIVRFFSGMFKPKRHILGSEFAGEVEAVGENVTLFKEGDNVFGLTGNIFGAHAEYLCLPESSPVVFKPSNLSFEEAAAVCDGAMLAYNYFKMFNLKKGQSILIYGATGSIGTAAVQFAKYYEVEITAVSSTKNMELLRCLGADEVVDYTKEDYTKINKTFDVIFDAVGKISYAKCKHLIKKGGIFTGTDFGPFPQNPILALLSVAGLTGRKIIFPLPKESKDDNNFFKELVEGGVFKPVIDRVYPLDEIVEAYRYVETEQKTGNVVLKIVP
jgi:NADPH:quinone reductase-like Zn-dependent oxidoreductase